MLGCKTDKIHATRDKGWGGTGRIRDKYASRQSFHWITGKFLFVAGMMLKLRIYDLMLLRERLQLLHIIHCSFRQADCSDVWNYYLASQSRSSMPQLRNNFKTWPSALTLQQFSNGIFHHENVVQKFLSSIHSRNLCGWVEWRSEKGSQQTQKHSWSLPVLVHLVHRTKTKKNPKSCSCLLCMPQSAENVDWNIKLLSGEINI